MKKLLSITVVLAGILLISSCGDVPLDVNKNIDNDSFDDYRFQNSFKEMRELSTEDLSFADHYSEMVSIYGDMTGDYSHMPAFVVLDTVTISGIVTSISQFGSFTLTDNTGNVYNVDIQHGPVWAMQDTPDYGLTTNMSLTVNGVIIKVTHNDGNEQTWLMAIRFILDDGTVIDVQPYTGGMPPWGGTHFGHGWMNSLGADGMNDFSHGGGMNGYGGSHHGNGGHHGSGG